MNWVIYWLGLLLGMKPEKLEIMPYGLSISFRLTPKDYNQKIRKGNQLNIKKVLVALAGPITNVIIMIIVTQLRVNVFEGMMMVYANLLLVLFNLLPIYPLDGGRVIKGILHIFLGKRKAETYINYISFITLMTITFVSSIVIYLVHNIAIFLMVLVLWGIFIHEDRLYKKRSKIYNLVEKSIEIK